MAVVREKTSRSSGQVARTASPAQGRRGLLINGTAFPLRRAALRGIAALVAIKLLEGIPAVRRFLHDDLCLLTARLATALTELFGVWIDRSGTWLLSRHRSFYVAYECTGWTAIVVICVALSFFPLAGRKRIIRIVLGCIAILVINLLRLVTLVWAGNVSFHTGEIVDYYVFGALTPCVVATIVLLSARGESGHAVPPRPRIGVK